MGDRSDTIVAIATAPGKGGIGIVRLSGVRAASIAKQLFRPKNETPLPWASHQLFFGDFLRINGEWLDEGYVVRFSSPQTFTGEEVVELQSHGSPLVLDELVQIAIKLGARLAEPGEFTKRAFLNGKMDLVQAEAVAELISAESKADLEGARRRLSGKLSGTLDQLRQDTLSLLAECEADIDFPEEELSITARPTLLRRFQQLLIEAKQLIDSYQSNQRLQRGFNVAIIGKPNVGKSSIFNRLIQIDRAIVTPIPGTTRDVLREEIEIDGRRIRLMDTAGIREKPSDEVERIGIERATQEALGADLICWVVEVGKEIDVPDNDMFKQKELVVIQNKIDIQVGAHFPKTPLPVIQLSAITGENFELLRRYIGKKACEMSQLVANGGISTDRQFSELSDYRNALDRAQIEMSRQVSPEFVAFELRQAFQHISRVLGKDESVEEILGEIFSKFCIGK